MINQTIEKINQREEKYRRRFAFSISLIVFVFVLGAWVLNRGIIDINGGGSAIFSKDKNTNQVASVETVPSPLDSSKQTFRSVWGEISKSYREVKSSISDVLVPFVTGIEVYERK